MTAKDPMQGCEGHWHWDGAGRRLTLTTESSSEFSDLKGTWSLDGLSPLLDGFSRTRLRLSLTGSDVTVNCALNLSDDRRIQLVGAFLNTNEAQGMILSGAEMANAVPDSDGPGPELHPVFQPIVSVADTSRIMGFEALARWNLRAVGLQQINILLHLCNDLWQGHCQQPRCRQL